MLEKKEFMYLLKGASRDIKEICFAGAELGVFHLEDIKNVKDMSVNQAQRYLRKMITERL